MRLAIKPSQVAGMLPAAFALAVTTGCGSSNYVSYANPPIGPTDSLVTNPLTLSFTAVGPAQARDVTIFNGPTGGPVKEMDTCGSNTRIVTIGTPTVSADGHPNYPITPEQPGSCTITFKNAAGATGTVSVTVSD